jgi:hypothetical protein
MMMMATTDMFYCSLLISDLEGEIKTISEAMNAMEVDDEVAT